VKGFRIIFLGAAAMILSAAGFWGAARASGWIIRVKVEVDYGPKGKPTFEKTVYLKKGSTVVEATKAVVDLSQGVVCCDLRDVQTIGGVQCDPKNQGWWLYDVNEKKGPVAAYRYLLADGDRLAWHYREKPETKKKF
jgi:hypothetical protein